MTKTSSECPYQSLTIDSRTNLDLGANNTPFEVFIQKKPNPEQESINYRVVDQASKDWISLHLLVDQNGQTKPTTFQVNVDDELGRQFTFRYPTDEPFTFISVGCVDDPLDNRPPTVEYYNIEVLDPDYLESQKKLYGLEK